MMRQPGARRSSCGGIPFGCNELRKSVGQRAVSAGSEAWMQSTLNSSNESLSSSAEAFVGVSTARSQK
eukprot:3607460-Pyramimonas_sp.AAC.1